MCERHAIATHHQLWSLIVTDDECHAKQRAANPLFVHEPCLLCAATLAWQCAHPPHVREWLPTTERAIDILVYRTGGRLLVPLQRLAQLPDPTVDASCAPLVQLALALKHCTSDSDVAMLSEYLATHPTIDATKWWMYVDSHRAESKIANVLGSQQYFAQHPPCSLSECSVTYGWDANIVRRGRVGTVRLFFAHLRCVVCSDRGHRAERAVCSVS
jgi:hypothetical protein